MRTLVVVPTVDEAENVATLLRAVRRSCPDAHVLVVDDASPDGTADRAEELAQELGQIAVLRRPPRSGLGSAYRDGLLRGVGEGYEVLVTMDADFSHDPTALPRLVAAASADGVGLAIGSRYVPGGSIPDWSPLRRALSRYGNVYSSLLLGAGITDMTSGYRAYRADTVRELYRRPVRTRGYGALIEMAYRVTLQGAAVVEIPITFVDRTRGRSKMSPHIALETLWHVTRMGVRGRLRPLRRRMEGRAWRRGARGRA